MLSGKYLFLFVAYILSLICSSIYFLLKTQGMSLKERNECISFKLNQDFLVKYGQDRMREVRFSFVILFIVVVWAPLMISLALYII